MNIPRIFGLEQGGDTRCFVLDNHRPFHLSNLYSRHNVVLVDDAINENADDDSVTPSDGSVLSLDSAASSDDDGESDDDDDDIDDIDGDNDLDDDGDEDGNGTKVKFGDAEDGAEDGAEEDADEVRGYYLK